MIPWAPKAGQLLSGNEPSVLCCHSVQQAVVEEQRGQYMDSHMTGSNVAKDMGRVRIDGRPLQ